MLSIGATVGRDRERGVTGIGQSVNMRSRPNGELWRSGVNLCMLVLLYGTIRTIA